MNCLPLIFVLAIAGISFILGIITTIACAWWWLPEDLEGDERE